MPACLATSDTVEGLSPEITRTETPCSLKYRKVSAASPPKPVGDENESHGTDTRLLQPVFLQIAIVSGGKKDTHALLRPGTDFFLSSFRRDPIINSERR